MKIAIAIFVKTPNVSPLKTRLAASLGKEKSLHFYELSLNSIVSMLKQTETNPYWAVAEKESLDNPLWSDFNRLHTGEGDLGDRQSHVYHELLKTHDAVMLIGADAPQLSIEKIEQAMDALKSHDYAIGPATDGGYYLLAGKRSIPDQVWATTPWSDVKTKEILVAQLDSKPYELDALTDVDTESDLKIMLSEMPQSLNENQVKLKEWIGEL
ncbi:TIGR04282 family arsenosugar biosynthesis glycosyltransferase [Cocleimonas sp. KMM 6892]|uniref:TIGR04282 family arsenosugar biosynthesis glycosyltransferase n=1 Tax=unclassified Cocleimonas TaxID=2639732 RepID=UPI002DBB49B0|nr:MULTISPECIES: TIGR04282 family arsenosugar biosynthesis glycosyltransferase [unclassified Cocleimonas]MEB8433243.1 TIGR04282 family arsenosugar biosynthesis glycosyltransferase [Cocleimonas sp. KMM 6892]MEC4715776.1 TIGR04282 family arsenosugar biosynthesis glycosyltransferase [Cocleimonas sp. KMM 6895]MEC4745237.1 TIGR04282 family arsenosugar biosynthesis glycosyltransferase [Cocleimonas sp. KMM 6896]